MTIKDLRMVETVKRGFFSRISMATFDFSYFIPGLPIVEQPFAAVAECRNVAILWFDPFPFLYPLDESLRTGALWFKNAL